MVLPQLNSKSEAAARHVATLEIRSDPTGHELAPLLPSKYGSVRAESAQRNATVEKWDGQLCGEGREFIGQAERLRREV